MGNKLLICLGNQKAEGLIMKDGVKGEKVLGLE